MKFTQLFKWPTNGRSQRVHVRVLPRKHTTKHLCHSTDRLSADQAEYSTEAILSPTLNGVTPYSIVYGGDVSVRKRSARHNTCRACCFITRSTGSTCRMLTTHASRAEHAKRVARRSRGRRRSTFPARAKRVARGARHYCTRAHFWGAASSQFGYPAYVVVPQGSH